MTNDKTKEIFDKVMEDDIPDPMQKLGKAIREVLKEMIKDSPMWMRFNFITHGIAERKEEEIDWDNVNNILRNNIDKYDFNAFEKITSKQELYNTIFNCNAASMNIGAWYKDTCKECGEEFYMTRGEISFFERKDFNLPKRCKDCRDKKSKPIQNKTSQKSNIVENSIVEKTTIQIAMEKVGL